MRIAVVSDIHGNLTALEAVASDVRAMSPDLVVHAGDLADSGSSPLEVIDRVRTLGWPGVMGNTDEMLVRPESLETFAKGSNAPPALWTAVREIAEATRDVLGEGRLSWLKALPFQAVFETLAVVHATPSSCWHVPPTDATDERLESIYGSLDRPVVVFGHTHVSSIRRLAGSSRLIVNSGSVGLPYDGDPRASYALLDGLTASIRRVEYDLERELKMLENCGLPGADWTAHMLRTSAPHMP